MNRLRDINIFTIKVFVMVYESLNSLSVANSLNVPPSKISRCLSALRHALDDKLFIRRQYGFEPTPMADKLYPYFQQMLTLCDQATENCERNQGQAKRNYVVCAPPTLSNRLAAILRKKAGENNFDLSLNVRPLTTNSGDDLIQSRADLLLAMKPCEKEQTDSQHVSMGEMTYVVGRKDHPIWQRPRHNMLQAIISYPFLITECAAFNDRIDPLELYAMDHGLKLELAGKASALSEVSEFLEESDALTFIGSHCAAEFLDAMPQIRAQTLSPVEYELLHERQTQPNYYSITRRDDSGLPPWFRDAVHEFIRGNVSALAS
ncbi:LysR family transcriptional regulator [Ferrimonas marina]|uniref:DNA-binding transcriptional regulator, LysR family n=1 Tax=Ferrimonas marina TaxID=299255 RepID=A0A1M5X5L4_9GAMM|nr:LysR family transcriptional regulator [Ferrimonas marina]SHH94784.1 DNA-binding transcriptional regulator, LysR family [Ferrimonas marina]